VNLYILRHGIAAELGTSGCERDSERPLTPEGKRKLARIAGAMKAMELSFDLILSSPFVRARQTAEMVAKSFRAEKKLAFSKALAVGGNPRALVEELRRCEPAPQEVLLVGHEPYLSGLISMLVAGHAGFSVTLKKGGLCKLSAESLKYGRCASLEWLLTPKQMAQMA
jgi:phosphohistidine phosphatase